MRGSTRTPSLAIVAIAEAICNAVTPISCPNDTESWVNSDHFSRPASVPGDSAVSSIPVRRANPKLKIPSRSVAASSRRLILVIPMLLDLAMTMVGVNMPFFETSLMARP